MASSRKKTHPADGIYTFSAGRARELRACSAHLAAWVQRHGEAVAPVTLADMTKQADSAGGAAVSWCLRSMLELSRIKSSEFDYSISQYRNAYTSVQEARVLMDALLIRAIREGRA